MFVRVLRKQRFLTVFNLVCPLPASPNTSESAVHTRQENQELEHDHHTGHHQAKHVARGKVPFIGRGVKELVPAIQVGV